VRNHLRRSVKGIKLLRDVRIPTRDGSWLGADIFLPLNSEVSPVLINMSVYGRAFRIGVIRNESDLLESEERENAWHETDREEIPLFFKWSETAFRPNSVDWVPRGYVMIRVDHRGIGNTPGELNPFSMQEALDYYDAIEWAARQSWSNGKVATFGASYHATNQFNVAALQPPSLKAIAPLACDADAYRDLSYPGGIYLEKYRKYWWEVLVGKQRNPQSSAAKFLEGFADHPWDDEYYHGNGFLSADFAKITIPMLTSVSQSEVIHGRAGYEAFQEVQSSTKHLLVWDAFYMPSMIEDSHADLCNFFDRHLKDMATATELPPVRMMMRLGGGKFKWRDASNWPIPSTEYRKIFLDAGAGDASGSLASVKPQQELFSEYSAEADPVDHENTPMAVFESEPLEADMEFAGHFRASLWVASTSSDADFYVALRVLDGTEDVSYRTIAPATFQGEDRGNRSSPPLTSGVLKASRRALDASRSTTARPWHTHLEADAKPMVPNEAVSIEVELLAVCGIVAAGRRLRLEISPIEGPGTMPGFERAYNASYHREATNRVLTGGAHASTITIPVVSN
jgi:predicted acyl esterase